MSLIRRYWFFLLIGLFIAAFLLLLVLIIISPKQDAQNRGFVGCTQNMINELVDCNKKVFCSVKAIANNTLCDAGVVITGFDGWISEKQPRPWSNYIFEPEAANNPLIDEDARNEYLKQFPETKKEMQNLDKLRKELENEENEQRFDKAPWEE